MLVINQVEHIDIDYKKGNVQGQIQAIADTKNAFLNELTEKASGKKVIALPIEATAIGNLKIQMNVQ